MLVVGGSAGLTGAFNFAVAPLTLNLQGLTFTVTNFAGGVTGKLVVNSQTDNALQASFTPAGSTTAIAVSGFLGGAINGLSPISFYREINNTTSFGPPQEHTTIQTVTVLSFNGQASLTPTSYVLSGSGSYTVTRTTTVTDAMGKGTRTTTTLANLALNKATAARSTQTVGGTTNPVSQSAMVSSARQVTGISPTAHRGGRSLDGRFQPGELDNQRFRQTANGQPPRDDEVKNDRG